MSIPPHLEDLDAAATLFPDFAGGVTERVAVAYLSADSIVLGFARFPSASALATPLPIRAVAAEALRLDAALAVLAHEHPDGDPTPSADDLAATRRLALALDLLDIELVDHLIFGGDRVVSLRQTGLL